MLCSELCDASAGKTERLRRSQKPALHAIHGKAQHLSLMLRFDMQFVLAYDSDETDDAPRYPVLMPPTIPYIRESKWLPLQVFAKALHITGTPPNHCNAVRMQWQSTHSALATTAASVPKNVLSVYLKGTGYLKRIGGALLLFARSRPYGRKTRRPVLLRAPLFVSLTLRAEKLVIRGVNSRALVEHLLKTARILQSTLHLFLSRTAALTAAQEMCRPLVSGI
ncbi:unnamed protein product [Rangifer tarandus platyrhynchus]|uniref:Uncharacterized protein n=1 Tax=Rangifer tarandus platyrhynchus TaxID=3082113 RepID=A0ABN8XIT0_RANTA|nr:unnamed protein product [Rangifer tarandus platyrhynchus]